MRKAIILVVLLAVTATVDNSPARSPSKQAPADKKLLEKLGKQIFFDKNLSNPPGLACVSCHNPESGYTGSVNPQINALFGVGSGVVSGRFENRKPLTIMYAKFCPDGPPYYDEGLKSYFGGFFLDGHANDFVDQVHFPLLNPNEMNNLINNHPAPQLVVQKVSSGHYAALVKQIYGANIFSQPSDKIILQLAKAVAAFESSPEISPFSSKYDAYLTGKAQLTPSEFNGLRLVTGSNTGRPGGMPYYKDAQCVLCHGIPTEQGDGPDLWTIYSYENVGVPKNPHNPYYNMIDKKINALGYNPLGSAYIDFGLGNYIYPTKGLSPGNSGVGSNGKGDFLAVNGKFKIPTLRNVDKRPSPNFIKAYGHNGYFKSLKDVVHFYNTRNLTTVPGEIINFSNPQAYANLKGKSLWPPPENPSSVTLQNPEGLPGQIGNLELTEQEENDIVAFLKTLSDGYIKR